MLRLTGTFAGVPNGTTIETVEEGPECKKAKLLINYTEHEVTATVLASPVSNSPSTTTTTTPTTRTTGTSTSSSTTTTGAPASGSAETGGPALVTGGNVALKLTCTGPGACKGTVELIARVTEKRSVKRHGKRRVGKRTYEVVIGTASFSLAEGASETLQVHLSSKGMTLLRKAGKKGLRVSLVGNDVKARSLVLKAPKTKPKAKHGNRK